MQEQKMIQKSAFTVFFVAYFFELSLTAEPNILFYGNILTKHRPIPGEVNVRKTLVAKTLGVADCRPGDGDFYPDSLTLNGYEEKWVLVSYEANGKPNRAMCGRYAGQVARNCLRGLALAESLRPC